MQLDFASSIDPDSPSAGPRDAGIPSSVEGGAVVASGSRWEQQAIYLEEETEWHKSARKANPPSEEKKERVWQEDMVMDERIGDRMTTFVNSMSDQEVGQTLLDDRAAGSSDHPQYSRWLHNFKTWSGWAAEDGRVKGWEQGLVGDESE